MTLSTTIFGLEITEWLGILVPTVGAIIWLIRLEGRVMNLRDAFLSCVKQHTACAADQTRRYETLRHMHDESNTRLSRIEGKLDILLNGKEPPEEPEDPHEE